MGNCRQVKIIAHRKGFSSKRHQKVPKFNVSLPLINDKSRSLPASAIACCSVNFSLACSCIRASSDNRCICCIDNS